MGLHYDALQAQLTDLHNLSMAYHALYWDQNVMMPPGGSAARATQMATLRRIRHERLTSDVMARLIERAAREVEPGSDEAHVVRVALKDADHARALPAAFVDDFTRATAEAFDVWRRAKEADDFEAFKPALQRVFDLKLKEADLRGYEGHPYDALLDTWERDMTTDQVRAIFDAHRDALVELAQMAHDNADRVDDSVLRQPFALDKQRELALFVSSALGVDYDRWSRLDTAPHPFCLQLAKDDIRVTTNYQPAFFNPAFFGTLHETGHALHARGIRDDLDGTFLSDMELISQALAESQSRTWENIVGRSREFWEWLTPHVRAYFPDLDADAEALYKAVNRSYSQPFRVRADELTYNLHIMLRFEIELAWVDGKVTVDDLPELWREAFRRYFGIVPETDAEGVLQDVHWSVGGIGAFNGYAVGNVLASQLYNQALAEHPDIPAQIARGEFAPLRRWLTDKVYQYGRIYNAQQTAERITGSGIRTEPYIAYLRTKYTELYA